LEHYRSMDGWTEFLLILRKPISTVMLTCNKNCWWWMHWWKYL